MPRLRSAILLVAIVGFILSACSPVTRPDTTYNPADLRFSGERALALETDFVQQFPYRHSGQPNNRLAAEWLKAEFEGLGLACELDAWQVVN